MNVLPLVAFSPFDKIHKYKYSGKRISQIQDELECGFIQQWLNFVYSLHPDITVHNIHTVLFTFPKVLIRRISLIIKSLKLVITSLILMALMCNVGGDVVRKLMSLFDKPLNSINSYLSMVPMHFHTIAIERIWLFYWKAIFPY